MFFSENRCCTIWLLYYLIDWLINVRLQEIVRLLATYLFLFSTSSTSSSVENWPLTTMIRFLMTSSAQSTSSRPPITTGRRLGFTWKPVERLLMEPSWPQPKHVTDETMLLRVAERPWSYLLYVYLNVFLQVVAVEVEHQVVDKVKAIAHDDEGKLVCQFGLLQRERGNRVLTPVWLHWNLSSDTWRKARGKVTLRKFFTLSGS